MFICSFRVLFLVWINTYEGWFVLCVCVCVCVCVNSKKRIQLSADNVVCRPIRLDKNPIKGVHGNTVFEVSVRDGTKRLFMTTSREEIGRASCRERVCQYV